MTWSFDGAAGTCSTALCHVCVCGVVGGGERRRERGGTCTLQCTVLSLLH